MRGSPPHIPDRIAIVGGGIAGAAAALHLRGLGARVLLVEREARDGVHASGLNAGMIRQVVASPALSALAVETARHFEGLRKHQPEFPFRRTGSVLLAGSARADELRSAAARAGGRLESAADIPGARPGDLALLTPGDGLVAPRRLLAWFLNEAMAAGARRQCADVDGLRVTAGRVDGLHLRDGSELEADLVIIAAGAWTAELARNAGGVSIALERRRRHLVPCRVADAPADDAPFLWHLDDRVYLRPWRLADGSRGLLACPGDDEPWSEPSASPDLAPRRAILESTLTRFRPGDSAPDFESPWAGVRTFSPDGDFVVGPDPQRPGLFWLAGLGGHGVSSSWALGRLVADLIRDEDALFARDLAPERFSTRPAEQGMNG